MDTYFYHTLQGMRLLIHAGIKVNPFDKRDPRWLVIEW